MYIDSITVSISPQNVKLVTQKAFYKSLLSQELQFFVLKYKSMCWLLCVMRLLIETSLILFYLETIRDKEVCYLVQTHKHFSIDGAPAGSSITAYISHGMKTLELVQYDYAEVSERLKTDLKLTTSIELLFPTLYNKVIKFLIQSGGGEGTKSVEHIRSEYPGCVGVQAKK